MTSTGQHIYEAFPLILEFAVLVSLFKNFSFTKISTGVLILLTTVLYVSIQLTWWYTHFYLEIERMPAALHFMWTTADIMTMVAFIQIISGRD